MNIIFYHPFLDPTGWIEGMKERLPQANIRQWVSGDDAPADYAMVWRPPHEMLAARKDLKGIFVLGAGVDAILKQQQEKPGTIPVGVPVMRLADKGMAIQMEEYATSKVLYYFRRMDEYHQLQSQRLWKPLPTYQHEEFVIGIMGAGALGYAVARRLIDFGFIVRTWSRTEKYFDKIRSFHGNEQLSEFLAGTKSIINLLPSTPETNAILDRRLFNQLQQGSYIINLARGAHLVEEDLLHALETGQIAAASLDVVVTEPLPYRHPFWTHPKVAITPHIAALTKSNEAMDSIRDNIVRIENGEPAHSVVDWIRGY